MSATPAKKSHVKKEENDQAKVSASLAEDKTEESKNDEPETPGLAQFQNDQIWRCLTSKIQEKNNRGLGATVLKEPALGRYDIH